MFEFFLWLMVSDRAQYHWEPMEFIEENEDQLDADLDGESERLKDKIRKACLDSGINFEILNLRYTHAGMAVSSGFGRNHALPSGTERKFLETLVSLAPTTYGVLYTLDSDRDDARGEFNVFKIANRIVVETKEMLVPSL